MKLFKLNERFATLTGNGTIGAVDLYSSNTVPNSMLGLRIHGNGGKEFVYVKAGASNLVVGNLLQAPAIDTQFDDMAVPAAVAAGFDAVGTGVTITNGTTSVSKGDFAGGSLVVSVTPGLDEEYTIVSNGAGTSGSSLVVYLDRPIRTAWTTSTKVTLRSQYNGVVQTPTTLTARAVGVAIYAIAAGEYGWIQTRGECGVLSDNSTGAVGSAISNSAATAGAVGVFVAGTGRSFVGHVTRALSSGKGVTAFLAGM